MGYAENQKEDSIPRPDACRKATAQQGWGHPVFAHDWQVKHFFLAPITIIGMKTPRHRLAASRWTRHCTWESSVTNAINIP
jgi:hypothetical protein